MWDMICALRKVILESMIHCWWLAKKTRICQPVLSTGPKVSNLLTSYPYFLLYKVWNQMSRRSTLRASSRHLSCLFLFGGYWKWRNGSVVLFWLFFCWDRTRHVFHLVSKDRSQQQEIVMKDADRLADNQTRFVHCQRLPQVSLYY